MLRAWLELARISNLPTVWTNVTAAWLLAGGGWGDAWDRGILGWLLLAGSLLYTGGMILNDAADAKFDRDHRQERPIPSGRISLAAAWGVGAGMMVIGGGIAVWQWANWMLVLGLIAAILFYDFYHKPWPGAVWVMGACRTLLFLMVASVLIPDLLIAHRPLVQPHPYPVIPWSLALGAYVVGLTMVARMEAAGARAGLLRSIFARALLYTPGIVAAALLFSPSRLKPLTILGDFTPLAPVILIFIFAAMVSHATRVMRMGGPAIGRAVGILLAGIAVVDALAVSQVSLPLAFGFVAIAPLLRLWQRKIAAT